MSGLLCQPLRAYPCLQLGALPTVYGINVSAATTALATTRRVLQGAPEDLGIEGPTGSTLVDADGNALVFDRSVQVQYEYPLQVARCLGYQFPYLYGDLYSFKD